MMAAAKCTILAALFALFLSSPADAQNYVQNSRWEVFRNDATAPRCCPVQVPEAGIWFPEGWRIAPGQGSTMLASIEANSTGNGEQGYALYIQWNRWQWVPCLSLPQSACPAYSEFGAGFLEHHIFEFDALAGQTVQLSFWARVDGCCVGLIPQIQMHYNQHPGIAVEAANEFILPPAVYVTDRWQHFTVPITLPTGVGRILDESRYVALAPTFSGATAPGLHLFHFELTVPTAAPGTVVTDYSPVLRQLRDLINATLP